MKNQYLGDFGDFGKFGLLRFIANHQITIAVNWYLTPDDKSNDGKFRSYLSQQQYRKYDPELFDLLKNTANISSRNICTFEKEQPIQNAVYYSALLELPNILSSSKAQRLSHREKWHENGLSACSNAELVFLDPDNGLRKGNPSSDVRSIKYVFEVEAAAYYLAGQDILYYCHKGRRTVKQWEDAKHIMLNTLPSAYLCGLTWHKGTQRTYIFVIHPENACRYMELLSSFMQTSWRDFFHMGELLETAKDRSLSTSVFRVGATYFSGPSPAKYRGQKRA